MASSKFKSMILPQAEQDIDETLGYISGELCNPTAAKNLLIKILEMVDRIAAFPYSMPVIKNKEITLGKEYRRAEVDNFTMIYKIVEDVKEIRIMAVFYGRSDILTKCMNRLS